MTEFLDLAARGKTAWWRYPLTIVLAVALWLLFCTLVIIGLELTHTMPADATAALTQPKHIQGFFGATGGLFGLLLLSFILVIRLLHGKRFGDIVGPWSWRRMGVAAGIWLGAGALGVAADFLIAPAGFRISAGAATATLALWAVPSLAIQTFTEEFIFRGYITQGLYLATRRPLATAVLSGLAFAVLHIPNGWPQAASAAAFGMVTAFIAMRTGGIAVTYGLHLANNLFGAIVVVSANDVFNGSPALVTQSTPRLMWLDVSFEVALLLAALWFFAFFRVKLFSPRPS